MTARTFLWKKIYVLSDLILGIECPYVARIAKLTPWFSTYRSRDRLLRKGSCDGGLELFLLLVPSFSLRA